MTPKDTDEEYLEKEVNIIMGGYPVSCKTIRQCKDLKKALLAWGMMLIERGKRTTDSKAFKVIREIAIEANTYTGDNHGMRHFGENFDSPEKGVDDEFEKRMK